MEAIRSRITRLDLTGSGRAASIATEQLSSLTGKLWQKPMSGSQPSRLRGNVLVRAQHRNGNGPYDPLSWSIARWDPPRSSIQPQFPRPACHQGLEQHLRPLIRFARVGPPCSTRQFGVSFSPDSQVLVFAP